MISVSRSAADEYSGRRSRSQTRNIAASAAARWRCAADPVAVTGTRKRGSSVALVAACLGPLAARSSADVCKAPLLRLGQPLKGRRERRKIAQGPLATSAAAQSDNRLRPEAAAAKAGGVLRLRACAKLTSCLPCPLLLCRSCRCADACAVRLAKHKAGSAGGARKTYKKRRWSPPA
jgi:hypothetical protein